MGVELEYGQVSSATVVINGRGMSQSLEGPRVRPPGAHFAPTIALNRTPIVR